MIVLLLFLILILVAILWPEALRTIFLIGLGILAIVALGGHV